jgi:nitrogen-specific signal transduction histidine kinase
MTGRSAYLALAIEARLDPNGKVIAADPALMQIHKANGGVEGGVLAIPPLLALAELAWLTRAKIERAVTIADGELDIDLWVGAVCRDDAVLLSIMGWQEATAPHLRTAAMPRKGFKQVTGLSRSILLVDREATIVSIAPELFDQIGWRNVGRPLSHVMESIEGKDLDKLADNPVDRMRVKLRAGGEEVDLAVSRIMDGEEALLGFEIAFAQPPGPVFGIQKSVIDPAATSAFGRQFASAVRQPLSRIIANAETIGAHTTGPIRENYAGYAHDIASAARHLSELVSDLEDLDTIDRHDFKVASERVGLGDIARRVAGLLALKAADHHISIHVPPEGHDVLAKGEFRRVLQIVLNLVGNAIRYAPDGSNVRLAIIEDPPSLTVSDEGSGIPEGDRDRVFEKFERLGRSGDGGSGLGLYISRRLARAMKGDLTLQESAAGGAMFVLRLPPFTTN